MRVKKENTIAEIKELTDIYSHCIHCGMCLTSCPTYELTRLETSSPRGRIKLIKSVAEGKLPVTKTFAYEMNYCLDCQACETACPAGVKYGKMVEAARVEIEENGYSSFIKSFLLKRVLPYRGRLKFAVKVLGLYQKSGLQKFLRSSGILRLFFSKLADVEELLPLIPGDSSDVLIKETSLPKGTEKLKLAFSYGCLMNVLLPDVNNDTVELLTKLGNTVITPPGQICCGSLSSHNGDIETARKLAIKNVTEFGKFQYDYLISNSAGCGAFMKEYGELLKNDKDYADPAAGFSSKVRDLTEFLSEINFSPDIPGMKEKVTYHDACHLVHTQKIYKQPRELLAKITAINYIPLEDSKKCCGSAGIYNLLHFDTSKELLKMKVDNINKTNADIILTGNPGCMLQIAYGVKKFKGNAKVLHPATFFNQLL